MNLISKMSTVLLIGLSFLTFESFAGGWIYGVRGPDSNRPVARAPDLIPGIFFNSNPGNPWSFQDLDAKKKKNLEKRYRAIKAEYSRLIDESLKIQNNLDGLQPGTKPYRQLAARLNEIDKRQIKLLDEKRLLEMQLFPCGIDNQRRYQSKFVLNVINDSKLRATVYGSDEEYGVFYGNVAPGSEADFKLAFDTLQRVSGVEAFPAKIVVSYPDGAMIPAAQGTRTTIKRNFRLVYPKKLPCITYYRLLLTDSDFGVSQGLPEQTGFSIYMDHVSYNGRTINNGARNDLTVYFTGRPKWPITASLTATNCPPGVNCPPQTMTFTSSSMKNRNAVIMPKVLYCYGFRRSESIGAEVRLRDSAGNETLPAAVTTHCIVR